MEMESQDKFIMRELDNAEVGLREDCEEDLLDVGCNVDLYVVNHESAGRAGGSGNFNFNFNFNFNGW